MAAAPPPSGGAAAERRLSEADRALLAALRAGAGSKHRVRNAYEVRGICKRVGLRGSKDEQRRALRNAAARVARATGGKVLFAEEGGRELVWLQAAATGDDGGGTGSAAAADREADGGAGGEEEEEEEDPGESMYIAVCDEMNIAAKVDEIGEKRPRSMYCEPDGDSQEVDDTKLAPIVRAALGCGVKELTVFNGRWAEQSEAAWTAGMQAGTQLESFSINHIGEEARMVRMIDAVGEAPQLRRVGLGNNVVGCSGLRALLSLAERCPSLKNLDLFNTGPWDPDGGSIGCWRQDATQNPDVALLQKLWLVLVKGRRGGVFNEAFMDDCQGGGVLLGWVHKQT